MIEVTTDEEYDLSVKIREIYSVYRDAEDLINIGAYVKGSNPKIDYAISKIDALKDFFKQKILEEVDFKQSYQALKEIIESNGQNEKI